MVQLKLSPSFLVLALLFALSMASVISEEAAPVESEVEVEKQGGQGNRPPGDGDRNECRRGNSRYCYQTEYCADHCRSGGGGGGGGARAACRSGGLGEYCDDLCACKHGRGWTGRHEGCHCYCYRRGGGGGGGGGDDDKAETGSEILP